MTKIAFVINSIHLGGPSYVVRSILANLDPAQFEAYVFTLFRKENTPEVVEELRQKGARVIENDYPGRLEVLAKKQAEFDRFLEQHGIEVIHSHGFIPDILSARCSAKNVRRLSTIHNNPFLDYPEVYGGLKGMVFTRVHLHFLKRLDRCACCSRYVYDSLRNQLPNLTVVRNGIGRTHAKQLVKRSDLGVPEDAVLFVYVGQLRQRKNVIWLLEQFRKCHKQNEYLLVVGDGRDRERCEEIADSHIRCLGFSADPYAYMQRADIFVSAALAEGFSISVLEALDNGLAVLLSDIPAHLEVFEAAKGDYIGEAFESGNGEDFERKLDALRGELWRVDKTAIQKVKDREMSAVKMTREYEALYIETDKGD